MIDHPHGWLSLLPPVTAIVLAILTRRIVFSLLLGIFVGALVLKDFNFFAAVEHMVSGHLWAKMIDSDMLHIFFFTIVMGTMVGMINRAAGMRGLVNRITPFASNRKRGQLTTWFLGLFVFFDDYANTMLLGNTLKPLTDRLKIAREKLAYLVDSTAAPVAGLALVSTWVAGEIGYVSDGIKELPPGTDWKAFDIFVQSIPYRFYVLFALLFVPIVALMGRDFGPMLKAERKAIEGLDPLDSNSDSSMSNLHPSDPTAPEEETPSRAINAVIPIVVTVVAVVYFLYVSGKVGAESNKLMDIFGNADSYGSLLWGALWGAGTAYVMIVAQRLLSFRELHQAAGNGARLMVPALIILWLAQSMSNMTGNNDIDDSHRSVVKGMHKAGATPKEIMEYVIINSEHDRSKPEKLADSVALLIELETDEYKERSKDEMYRIVHEENVVDRKALKTKLVPFELAEWDRLKSRLEPITRSVGNESNTVSVLSSQAYGKKPNVEQLDLASEFWTAKKQEIPRWNSATEINKSPELEKYAAPETEDQNLIESAEPYTREVIVYHYTFRHSRLYTGTYLSERLSTLRDSDGFIANNFVQLLPTIVFILASLVAFSTGTSWGTMGIVMPLVIPLAFSQLTYGDATVTAGNPVFLCCVGSVLAGAIFGDHCSPISDTTVLSSQASGCDHVAHVRTQLPYALVIGIISIVCGTLPIGYGVSVWLMIPIGLAGMIGTLYLIGTKVESDTGT